MSRKRTASFRSSSVIPIPNFQVYQYQYIRPGCYYLPQVIPEVNPYNFTHLNHWQPHCIAATYVVDSFGRANYPSDLEYQIQVSTSMNPQPREITYSYYDDGEIEISSIPQIEEEEDIRDDQDVKPRKRKRLYDIYHEPVAKKSNGVELPGSSAYRSKEGYLVEEPKENDKLKF